jgi:uncharacterized membrane protein
VAFKADEPGMKVLGIGVALVVFALITWSILRIVTGLRRRRN